MDTQRYPCLVLSSSKLWHRLLLLRSLQLCSRSYSNVTYIGAHDSYAIDSSALDG